jgi:iron-sulfur cluster assembly accessory protein
MTTATTIVNITEKAAQKIQQLMASENNPNLALRVAVVGGGCSGYSYGMSFAEGGRPDDIASEQHGIKVIVDPASAPLLQGAQIDFIESIQGTGFSITNPNAKSSCGCGSSFSADEAPAEGAAHSHSHRGGGCGSGGCGSH